MEDHGRVLPSIFFKRGKHIEYLRRGSSFRRVGRKGDIETALVSSLYTDGHDIPHVRFHVVFEKPFRAPVKDGPRVLSMTQFFKQFPDRVPQAPQVPKVPQVAEREAPRDSGTTERLAAAPAEILAKPLAEAPVDSAHASMPAPVSAMPEPKLAPVKLIPQAATISKAA